MKIAAINGSPKGKFSNTNVMVNCLGQSVSAETIVRTKLYA